MFEKKYRCFANKPCLQSKEAFFTTKRSLVCNAKKPCLQTIAVRQKIRESCTIAFIKQIAWNLKFAGLLEIYHY